ncbi:hypothetical protein HDU92_000682, partial [Lobulomyces angularis]
EYIRLTNLAFGINSNVAPVFLLDEIQTLAFTSTRVVSTISSKGVSTYHTQLTLLLTQLAGKHRPLCICSGTNNGNIKSITEKSKIVPQLLRLKPLVTSSMEYWKQRSEYWGKTFEIFESDMALIDSLICGTYQIPRFLSIAHDVWYTSKLNSYITNREFVTLTFEQKVTKYYDEIPNMLMSNEYTPEDLFHIFIACGVHWEVKDEYSYVPGTQIQWKTLIQNSLIFPYTRNCYLIPFKLIWNPHLSNLDLKEITVRKDDIIRYGMSKLTDFNLENLFLEYDKLSKYNLYNFGMAYEYLLAASLAVKYYLVSITRKNLESKITFSSIYDFSSNFDFKEFDVYINFSKGIISSKKEVFVDEKDLSNAIYHNNLNHNAHHDLILPAKKDEVRFNVAVSVKSSAVRPKRSDLKSQCLEKNSKKAVDIL